MGHRLRLSGPANEDIRSIWEYTRATYDYEQTIAYSELLEQAIREVVADPERPSSIPRP
jgi:plasmid stabilization system protein ParE